MMSNNLPKNNNPKLKWWQKGALVGLGIALITLIIVVPVVQIGFSAFVGGPIVILFVELPVLPIFVLVGNFLGTPGYTIIWPSLGTGTLLLAHFISWTLGGIVYAYIFHTIRRLTKEKPSGTVLPIVYIVAYFGIMALIVLVSLGRGAREKKDAGIMNDMSRLRTSIEIYYYGREEGFSGVNCSLAELSSICSEIKEYAGETPTIKSSTKNYCLYVKLPSGEYYCLTNVSSSRKTTISPGKSGYCDGITFSCP